VSVKKVLNVVTLHLACESLNLTRVLNELAIKAVEHKT